MKIYHNITFTNEKNGKKIIEELTINNIQFDREMLNVKISEDDEKWPIIEKLLLRYPTSLDFSSTKFTLQELMNSNWLMVATDWHHGYPMPDDDDGYKQITYDLKNYCEVCGIGKIQIAPFRMKSEPKWGKRNILQLHWVYDEYFVTPEVWEEYFNPMGIDKLPVLRYKKEVPLQTVVQLKIDSICDANLVLDDFGYEICKTCKKKKYLPFNGRGFYPPMKSMPEGVHAFKSIEFFGSGASAYREIFFSQELFRKIYQKIKGINFYPVQER